MNRLLTILFGLSLIFTLSVAVSGCGDDDEGEVCTESGNCLCENATACSEECTGPNCSYSCSNSDSCTFKCDAGGCNVNATNAGVVLLDCPGGRCTLACTNADSCEITNCADCTCTEDALPCGGLGF